MWSKLFFAALAIAGTSATAAYFASEVYAIDAPEVLPQHVALLTGVISALGGLAATGIALLVWDMPWFVRCWRAHRTSGTAPEPQTAHDAQANIPSPTAGLNAPQTLPPPIPQTDPPRDKP